MNGIIEVIFSILGKAWDVYDQASKANAADADAAKRLLEQADRQLDDALAALKAGIASNDAAIDAELK